MATAREICRTSARIWTPLRERFDEVLADNGLKRDAYLDLVLAVEIPALDAEIKDRNSSAARQHVAGRLRALEPKLVTFKLRKDLLRRLDAICERKRICRDAFLNRLLFLLTATPQTIDILFFEGDSTWRSDVWSECKHDGPFFSSVFFPLSPGANPFWAIRAGLQLRNERRDAAGEETLEGVYGATLWQPDNEQLIGLSCHLPDELVPRTAASKGFYKRLAELTGRPESFWRRK